MKKVKKKDKVIKKKEYKIRVCPYKMKLPDSFRRQLIMVYYGSHFDFT